MSGLELVAAFLAGVVMGGALDSFVLPLLVDAWIDRLRQCDAAELVGIRPSTVKRHLADLRARSGLSTEQLIYRGRAEGWLVVSSLEPR